MEEPPKTAAVVEAVTALAYWLLVQVSALAWGCQRSARFVREPVRKMLERAGLAGGRIGTKRELQPAPSVSQVV